MIIQTLRMIMAYSHRWLPDKTLFQCVPPNPSESDLLGPYNKLLYTLFPTSTNSTAAPWYSEPTASELDDLVLIFNVFLKNTPVFVLHALGTKLCFYHLDSTRAHAEILPRATPCRPAMVNDPAPAERWDCDILEAGREKRFRAVVDKIKEACARLEA
ncbi:hypothetical protein OBBRIDRAFT_813038 [Obba rivulosa]|uniref:Uncharacterized protein n=1 Tax=Obba rivulosa TaxID=1052685 RepID=A0A8E2AX48_9APHY|nr:hypothetical protein OBBRIDRAFT_813038 [Obba rivulosa]